MVELCRLSVSGIKIQKDKYRTAAGATLGETAFWQSTENESNVVSFKRAIVQCKLNGFGLDEEFGLEKSGSNRGFRDWLDRIAN